MPSRKRLNKAAVVESAAELVQTEGLAALSLNRLAARLQVQPLHRFDVGMGGPGRSGSVKIVGGGLGLVIDARGRPLQLPADSAHRIEMVKKWFWTVGVSS